MNTILTVDSKDFNKTIYSLIEQGGYLCSEKEYEKLCECVKRTKSLDAVLAAIGALVYDKRKFLITDKVVKGNESVPITTVIKKYNKNRGKPMDLNSVNIEQIVKQVISGLGNSNSSAASGDIPKTAKVAVLTDLEKFDIK